MDRTTKEIIVERLNHLMRVTPEIDTLTKLSEKSGVGYGTIQRLMSNSESDITIQKVEKIAECFGLSFDELVARPGTVKGLDDEELSLLMAYRSLDKKDRDEVRFFTSSKSLINKMKSQGS